MASVDALALVSKVLLDRRVLEQRDEIERLKMEIFWLENGYFSFRTVMSDFNRAFTMCGCNACYTSGRCRNIVRDSQQDYCLFSEAFEKKLSEAGFTFGPVPTPALAWTSDEEYVRDIITNGEFHICKFDRKWTIWSLGKRLKAAKSEADPEIVKYVQFLHDMQMSVWKQFKSRRRAVG